MTAFDAAAGGGGATTMKGGLLMTSLATGHAESQMSVGFGRRRRP